jgi:cell division protein FtsI/penicillin-binding protein 2
MYKYTYYFEGKANKSKCERIKKGAKLDIKRYFTYKNQIEKIAQLKREVDNWSCPTEPRVPFGFYEDLQQQDIKGRAIIGNPKNRIWEWASTSASILRDELDNFKKEHNNTLITEAKMTVDVPKNIDFKDGVNSALELIEKSIGNRLYVNLNGDKSDSRPQANIWISVVDENGEVKYIYKRGNTFLPRRIGSVSKIFEAIALGNRGDKWNYYYCNEPFNGLHNSDGSRGGECRNNSDKNIYSAREVFGASKNLPMKSALEKYVIKDSRGISIIEDRISDKELERIYKAFNLKRDNKTSMRYELSFGLVNSTPLELQKSIHKLTHLLYSKGRYREAHIAKYIKYKKIKDFKIQNGGVVRNLYTRSIPPETKKMFDKNTKEYIKTVLKSPLNPHYGTLKSFNSIPNFQNLFMKSGTTDKVVDGERVTQSKWVAGAISVKGRPYSFVIMVHSENGIGKKIGHHEMSQPIFREIVKALNGD